MTMAKIKELKEQLNSEFSNIFQVSLHPFARYFSRSLALALAVSALYVSLAFSWLSRSLSRLLSPPSLSLAVAALSRSLARTHSLVLVLSRSSPPPPTPEARTKQQEVR
jgi:energy-coupling factor transporter transmembrane protein EcfT